MFKCSVMFAIFFLNIEMFDVRLYANIHMFECSDIREYSNVRMFANVKVFKCSMFVGSWSQAPSYGENLY